MRIGPVFLMGFCIQKFHIKAVSYTHLTVRRSRGKVDGSLQKVEMTLTNLTSGVEQQGTCLLYTSGRRPDIARSSRSLTGNGSSGYQIHSSGSADQQPSRTEADRGDPADGEI